MGKKSNRQWGLISVSLSSLSFLHPLNLSNNDFSGMIPYTGHMTTFDASLFAGNPGLCGDPLAIKYPGYDGDSNKGLVFNQNRNDDYFIDK